MKRSQDGPVDEGGVLIADVDARGNDRVGFRICGGMGDGRRGLLWLRQCVVQRVQVFAYVFVELRQNTS
jgi:hypothetical protein